MADFFNDEDDAAGEREEGYGPRPLGWRIAGTVLKIIFWGLIVFINGMLFWRMFTSGDPASMKVINGNGTLAVAYEEALAAGGLDGFAIYQENHVDITDKDHNYAYFALTDAVIFPTAEQVQVVFRYNNSTLEHLAEDYALDFEPDRNRDWYDVTLRVLVDMTPDNKTDNSDPDTCRVLRIDATSVDTAKKTLHNYRRFTFDGLPDFYDIIAMYVDIYYTEDTDYNAAPYGELCIYQYYYRNAEYNLDRKDIAAIEAAG